MGARTNQSCAAISRRAVLNTAGIAAAGFNARPAGGAVSAKTGPEVYTRIGVQPFINCTATYTINGGSATLPQVIEAIKQSSKEEIVGMLRAVEVWCTERDVQADFREWNRWYRHITEQITRVPGVSAEMREPARGGPFPTLSVSWDPEKIGLNAGEIGRRLLEGKPRIMSHAEGEGHSFVIRPVALKPGEYKIVAQRLYEIFQAAPKSSPANPAPAAPTLDISGIWDVEIQYETGGARHQLVLHTNGNQLTGSHQGWAYHGNVSGVIDGSRVELRSSLPAEGTPLP